MRIGTWNVEYAAGADKNRLRFDRLNDEKADIWVLTETHDDLNLSETHRAVSTVQRPTGRAGGRWTTIWTRWAVREVVAVDDPVRTTAALIDAPSGPLLVYGTVLPWGTDPGPTGGARGWTEMDRVLPLQLAEWRRLRARYPEAALVVAGDFNVNLGGPHYYGTERARKVLRAGLEELQLGCATESDRVPSGALVHPPIDHIVVPAAWLPRTTVSSAWEGRDPHGRGLSDHSGLVVEVQPPLSVSAGPS